MVSASEMLDRAISDLEARLGMKPGQELIAGAKQGKKGSAEKTKQPQRPRVSKKEEAAAAVDHDQPDICQLEFKVGTIIKVWNHPEADKLYCEEIDVGEEAPRQIASGLRPHFTLEQMQGQRLLVVANLKAKNLVRFKSHGMVLCAAAPTEDGGEKVEFVEPPEGAKIGEVVTFEGLAAPKPLPPAQVEKKKIFVVCAEKMKTNGDCLATWDGHVFMTSAGPCKAKTIANGAMR